MEARILIVDIETRVSWGRVSSRSKLNDILIVLLPRSTCLTFVCTVYSVLFTLFCEVLTVRPDIFFALVIDIIDIMAP